MDRKRRCVKLSLYTPPHWSVQLSQYGGIVICCCQPGTRGKHGDAWWKKGGNWVTLKDACKPHLVAAYISQFDQNRPRYKELGSGVIFPLFFLSFLTVSIEIHGSLFPLYQIGNWKLSSVYNFSCRILGLVCCINIGDYIFPPISMRKHYLEEIWQDAVGKGCDVMQKLMLYNIEQL